MTIPNPSFEDAGAAPGLADQWSVSISTTGGLIADFAEGGIPKPVEDFSGTSWGTDPYVHTVSGGTPQIFDSDESPTPSGAEMFDRWSNNAAYQTVVSGGAAVQFNGNTLLYEGFEAADWGTDPYVTEVSVSAGNAGTTVLETFESGWGTYTTTVAAGVNGDSVLFDDGASDVEDFEEVEADVLFVVSDVGSGLCAVPTGVHGKSNGDLVTVTSTGSRPSGLGANIPYYVIVVTTTTFRLSKTNGGPAVPFGDLGSGSHFLHADETAFWTLTE